MIWKYLAALALLILTSIPPWYSYFTRRLVETESIKVYTLEEIEMGGRLSEERARRREGEEEIGPFTRLMLRIAGDYDRAVFYLKGCSVMLLSFSLALDNYWRIPAFLAGIMAVAPELTASRLRLELPIARHRSKE